MIPKPEEVLIEAIGPIQWNLDGSASKAQLVTAMREYGRRLLDHVAEGAKVEYYSHMDNQWHELVIADPDDKLHRVDKQSILKIKDEL